MVGGCGYEFRIFRKIVTNIAFEFRSGLALGKVIGIRFCLFTGGLLGGFIGRGFRTGGIAEVILDEIRILITGFILLEILLIVLIGIGIAVIYLEVILIGQCRQFGVFTDDILGDAVTEQGMDIFLKGHADRFGRGFDILNRLFNGFQIGFFQFHTGGFSGFTQYQYLLQIAFGFVHEHIEPGNAGFLIIILILQFLGNIQSLKSGIFPALTISVIKKEVCNRLGDRKVFGFSGNGIGRYRIGIGGNHRRTAGIGAVGIVVIGRAAAGKGRSKQQGGRYGKDHQSFF